MSVIHPDDETYMRKALDQAKRARDLGEVPVGAVITRDNRVIARAHNQVEQLHDPTAHAEMIAITQAADAIGDWRLEECTLYVTLEPCPMCAGAMVRGRIPKLVYGTNDPKGGACGTLYNIVQDHRLNHHMSIKRGVLEEECSNLLTNFFSEKRTDPPSEN